MKTIILTILLSAAAFAQAPWGLDRIDQRTLPLDGVYSYTATGAGVTVYVVDSGIQLNNPEFQGRAVKGYGQNSAQCDGHGTAVAAIIGGTTYGVAKQANLVSVQVRCSGFAQLADVLKGLDWAWRDCKRKQTSGGRCVVNISMTSQYNTSFNDAVQRLVNLGAIVVVAAGNYGDNACAYSPSAVLDAIAVGGTRQDDSALSYSNHGACVDLYAPGEGIPTTWNTGVSTYFSGTSAASPHVAGVVATYLETYPLATPAEVQTAMIVRATSGVLIGADPNRLLYSRF